MSLDRDQPPDTEKARLGARVGARAIPRRDPVVDDDEPLLVEALGLREVMREALRDRDVDVRKRAHGSVGKPEEAPLAELVEAVLRREAERNAGHRARELPVHVCVYEMGVQDPRLTA